ncbi:hypothetical protein B0T18DRAFT_322503 [Schizothecium vesticola]|uniref:C2 domain-containing protein n=1 Tax=Schizothecium vesticola TaxID=314040 RepID=A0AA40F2T0_9PEZI|nr:hypothetical protein B0T18DRAFT_322503 [Schizothecium vesticola]
MRDLFDIERQKLANKKEKIKSKTNPPGGFDPTPLPDAPPGYTVKFTIHKAWNLPVADVKSQSADPFVHSTLVADVPRRHKEDPLLTHRTRTIRRTTEPCWEEEWIVANIPSSGFTLKCRLYDEDWPDSNDRLGNVTVTVPHVDEDWEGFGDNGRIFDVRKRAGSKRAYLVKGVTSTFCRHASMTPRLHLSAKVLGKSDPPYAQMCTIGPTTWIKHYSPMIGRLFTHTKVNREEEHDADVSKRNSEDRRTKKYDFQANEIQLSGPAPPKLYHRFVEFRPIIGPMFASTGIRGRILNKVLHHQHARVYNFDTSTEYGVFEPRSEEASLQFLKMAHFDEGGRLFTYVITLDALLRFTETGKEFGIDLLSKHTMHSNVATYIACSGEFFIRRLHHPHHHPRSSSPSPQDEAAHPPLDLPGGPPDSPPPLDPSHYELIIDNDSGTYRPDKSVLPDLKGFLEEQFPGLRIRVMDCGEEELKTLKKAQFEAKKKQGPRVRMVLNRSPSASSFSSDDESRLGELTDNAPVRSKKEKVFDVISDPYQIKAYMRRGGEKGKAVVGGADEAKPEVNGAEPAPNGAGPRRGGDEAGGLGA